MTFALTAIGGATIGGALIQADAIGSAADQTDAANALAAGTSLAAQQQARRDQAPFLSAALGDVTGTTFNEELFNSARERFDADVAEIRGSFGTSRVAFNKEQEALKALGNRPTRADFTTPVREGGALQQFQAGIDQAPAVPTIDQFQGQAVAAPTINRFQGQAVQSPELVQAGPLASLQQFGGQSVQAPSLNQFQGQAVNAPSLQQFQGQAPNLEAFNFDPQAALDSPALRFQQEQGQRQVDRVAGKNRQLGSGQRLIDAQRFGQGLASQSLTDEFNRQLSGVNQRNLATQQGFGNQVQLSNLANQTAAQQFGLQGQTLGQQADINRLQNQIAGQQFGLQGQTLGQDIDINQLQNFITQQGIGNRNVQTDLANRIAGQQFGLNTQTLGQQQGLNQFGNQQAVEQQNLNRQFLTDQLDLSNVNQNRLLTQFGLNNDQFNQRLNRLAGLVDVGARTGAGLAQSGQQAANNVAGLISAGGQTRAAAGLGRANVIGGALQQGAGLLAQSGAFAPNDPRFTFQQANNFQGNLPFGPQPLGPQ